MAKTQSKLGTDEVPDDINMDLEDSKLSENHHDFHSEDKTNIWTEEKDKSEDGSDSDNKGQFVSQSYDEEEIEQPSFLRRWKRRGAKKNSKSDDSDNV
jgi:hypothetical protein